MPKQYFFRVTSRKKGNPQRVLITSGFKTYRQANEAANAAIIIVEADNYKLKRFVIGSTGGSEGPEIHNDARY